MVKISALKLKLNFEGDAKLVWTKMPIFSLGRITLWYCGYVARAYRACIIGLLDVVSVLSIIYSVPAKATVIVLSTKMHPSNVGRGDKMFYINITLFPPQHWWGAFLCSKWLLLPWQILNTWYVTHLQHPVHALQILATSMPQYHRCILLRAKMVFSFVLRLCRLLNLNAISTH